MAQKLLVEGDTDVHFITHLCMKRGLNAPKGYETETAYKKDFVASAGSKSKLKAQLKLLLKKTDSDIQNLGIVLDADSQTQNAATDTWQAIKSILQVNGYQNLPNTPLSKGTIITQIGKPKIGVWIMPNNQENGYLEDFYAQMIAPEDTFWQKAVQITEGYIENKENRFREIALSKAKVHTWLAWQEHPELPLGLSVSAYHKLLNLNHPLADDFVEWFKATFELSER
jgi:hypothetical protein